jgi:hypothetical protein
VSIDLEKENIDALIKAKTALADQSNLLIKTTENMSLNVSELNGNSKSDTLISPCSV